MPVPQGFDYGQHLLEMIGSFWTTVYQDQDLIKDFVHGLSDVLGQAFLTFLEEVRTLALRDVPVFRTERWKLLTFKESELNQNNATVLKFGGSTAFKGQSAKFGPQPVGTEYAAGVTFQFGGFAKGQYYAFALPADLVDIEAYLVNRMYDPSLVWTKGIDYQVSPGVIIFARDPFEQPLLPIRNVLDTEGNVIDREVALWAYNAKYDKEDLWKHYGCFLNVKLGSSEDYRSFIRAAFGLFMLGPRVNTLVGLLTALFGLPVIKETTETVLSIRSIRGEHVIETDQHTYTVPSTITLNPSIVEEASLPIFTALTDTVTLLDNSSQPQWWRNHDFLPFPVQILNGEYNSALTIFNREVTVPVKLDETFVFAASGAMSSEQRERLNNLPLTLDSGWRFDEPFVTINCLDYIFEQVVRNNLMLLSVKTSDIALAPLTSSAFELFNEALPVGIYMITLFNHALTTDYDLATRVDDTLDTGKGQGFVEDYDIHTRVAAGSYGLPRLDTGLHLGPPTEFFFDTSVFQPQLTIMKRYHRCRE